VTTSAGRAIQHKLPEVIAAAVVEFITGTLLENPHRVGNALHRELTGIYSARRGVRCPCRERYGFGSPST